MYTAHAKLNLRLAVLAREESRFHQIETLFCLLELHDSLEIEPRGNGIELVVDGATLGPEKENLVYRAALGFFRSARMAPAARIRLTKRIPHRAGLGGGSSDAAATLLALNALHGHPLGGPELRRLALALGSDVPFFLANTPFALGWGRGQRLLTLPPPPAAPALLVVPDARVDTGAAYHALASSRGPRAEPAEPRTISSDELRGWTGIAANAANDFESVVFERLPELAGIRADLEAAGARIARMTGTGSALFGIFDRAPDRDRAADTLRARYPEADIVRTGTVDRL